MKGRWTAPLSKYRYLIVLLMVIAVASVVALARPGLRPADPNSQAACSNPFADFRGQRGQLWIGGQTFETAYALTPEEMNKGLGGISCLAPDDAMVFIYKEPVISSFWMKDMVMPIDIIWMDANGVVVTVAGNVTPDTYPKNFVPEAPASVVLETRAGTAEANRWGTGTALINPAALPRPASQ